jgi:N-acetyl sugar amidotransferase
MVDKMREYQICTKCVMDTSDPNITFDENGICSHCKSFNYVDSKDFNNESILLSHINIIKKAGKGKKYDCIIGVSGGVDSSYVAYLVKKYGLRPLAIHLDNGWNSELAVQNIRRMLEILEIDLFTYVLDWEEFRDLQVSFLKSGTPDAEIPTDHAITAIIFKLAAKHNIKYLISGSNIATESIGVKAWSHGHSDWRYIKSVHKKFSNKKLKSYPHYGFLDLVYYKIVKQQKSFKILNFINYNKAEAIKELEINFGWKYYGGKHYESIYTRFYQGYYLPTKFGFDKRRSHLSSQILNGHVSRQEALKELLSDAYNPIDYQQDRIYVLKKLKLDENDFNSIVESKNKCFQDYPSYETHFFLKYLKKNYKFLQSKISFLKGIGF